MQRSHDPSRSDLSAQLIHAEAIVESLQAQLWSGGFDGDMFAAGVEGACKVRSHSEPELGAAAGAEMFERALALGQRWQQVPVYGALELEMTRL